VRTVGDDRPKPISEDAAEIVDESVCR